MFFNTIYRVESEYYDDTDRNRNVSCQVNNINIFNNIFYLKI